MTRKETLDILPFVELLTAVTILHIPPPQFIPAKNNRDFLKIIAGKELGKIKGQHSQNMH